MTTPLTYKVVKAILLIAGVALIGALTPWALQRYRHHAKVQQHIRQRETVDTSGVLHHLATTIPFTRGCASVDEWRRLNPLRKDAWGHEIRLVCWESRKEFEVRSAGPDGIFDNDDDMKDLGPKIGVE
jgi:hypothetical protein